MSENERNERAEFIKRAGEVAEEHADKLAADMLAARLDGASKDLASLHATIDALALLGFKARVPLADQWVGKTLETDEMRRERDRRFMHAVHASVPEVESASHVAYAIELARRCAAQACFQASNTSRPSIKRIPCASPNAPREN